MNLDLFESLVLVVHVIAALGIIGLVLIQHGKGADIRKWRCGEFSNPYDYLDRDCIFFNELWSRLCCTRALDCSPDRGYAAN
jgi:hypothetical protein